MRSDRPRSAVPVRRLEQRWPSGVGRAALFMSNDIRRALFAPVPRSDAVNKAQRVSGRRHAILRSPLPTPDLPLRSGEWDTARVRGIRVTIVVGTGGATGPWPPHFFAKIILKSFPSFIKCNFDTENDSPGRVEHKSALKCIVDGLVFAGDEIEVSLAPSLFVTFLRPCGSRWTHQSSRQTVSSPPERGPAGGKQSDVSSIW